jgi:hypothetical protein
MCAADTMISILNGDKNIANGIVTTRTAVVTTEASSSAVGGGRPKGATKVASISMSTKIKHCYHLSVEKCKSVRKESKQKDKERLKKGTHLYSFEARKGGAWYSSWDENKFRNNQKQIKAQHHECHRRRT